MYRQGSLIESRSAIRTPELVPDRILDTSAHHRVCSRVLHPPHGADLLHALILASCNDGRMVVFNVIGRDLCVIVPDGLVGDVVFHTELLEQDISDIAFICQHSLYGRLAPFVRTVWAFNMPLFHISSDIGDAASVLVEPEHFLNDRCCFRIDLVFAIPVLLISVQSAPAGVSLFKALSDSPDRIL